MPLLGQRLKLFRRRQFAEFVDSFCSFAKSQVVDWQNISPSQDKDEKHFSRPSSDSSDSVQLCHDLLIRQIFEGFELKSSVDDSVAEVVNVGDFLWRKADRAKPTLTCPQVLLWFRYSSIV